MPRSTIPTEPNAFINTVWWGLPWLRVERWTINKAVALPDGEIVRGTTNTFYALKLLWLKVTFSFLPLD